jgi:hypothetical protein
MGEQALIGWVEASISRLFEGLAARVSRVVRGEKGNRDEG